MLRSETLIVQIDCPFADTYEFLADPLNLPTWLEGLGGRIQHLDGNRWVADAAPGRKIFEFAPRNTFGVIDFSVSVEDRSARATPVRLIRNGDGVELMLTMFQVDGVTDDAFQSELEWIRADLATLKALLESRQRR